MTLNLFNRFEFDGVTKKKRFKFNEFSSLWINKFIGIKVAYMMGMIKLKVIKR